MLSLFDKCEKYTLADDIKAQGLYPYFHELQSRQDVEVIMEGKRRIMLGSNNYLGLTVDPRVIAAGKKALDEYGSGCSGSRFLNGTLNLHLDLERDLAEFLGKDDVITYSTGFQSNLGIISTIAGRGDYIICDKENHASIYDGCRLSYAEMKRYRHSDMNDLDALLATLPAEAGKLIVTDGVFSMSGDIAKLDRIVELAEKYGAAVMVDDAHGLGVLGNCGRGTADYFGLTDKVDFIMGTFSKSLASLGGFVAGAKKPMDYVRHNSRPFIFSASMTPAACACAHASLNIIKSTPELVERLNYLAGFMKHALVERGVKIIESPTPIIPIYTYKTENTFRASKMLYDRGVYVNNVVPPATAPGECLLRVSLMASHTEALILEAVDIISDVLGEILK